MIEKKMELGDLYDFYGELLTKKQKEILNQYLLDDLSFGEISENIDISRQAVYDTIKRSAKILHGYEEKLKLVEKYRNRLNKDKEILTLLLEIKDRLTDVAYNKKIDNLIELVRD